MEVYAYSCREDDSIIPDDLREGYEGFVISVRFCHILQRANGDDAVVLDSYSELLRYGVVDHLNSYLGELTAYSTVDLPEAFKDLVLGYVKACPRVNLPQEIEELVANEVFSLAKSMWNDVGNQGEGCIKKVMPIVAETVVRTVREPNETEQEAIARACIEYTESVIQDRFTHRVTLVSDNLNPQASEVLTARLSRIKALEYVRLEDLSSAIICRKCEQKISAGTVVCRLPCSHEYHASCIIRQSTLADMCVRCSPPANRS